MAKVASVAVGAPLQLADVQVGLERALGGRFNDGALEVPDPDLSVEVDKYDGWAGFNYSVLVYALTNAEAAEGARWVRDRLAEHTTWRLATKFDRNDEPVDERPALSTT